MLLADFANKMSGENLLHEMSKLDGKRAVEGIEEGERGGSRCNESGVRGGERG